MERLITILGPTAVGKTELTLRLAEEFSTVVISGDAYQVYRNFNIGTAKPSTAELARVPHYLINIRNPEEQYSVADFQADAASIITACDSKGQVPILSGGTGLYVQSLLEKYEFSEVPPNPALRKRLETIYETYHLEGLQGYAYAMASQYGIELTGTDPHRLYRAIELMHQGDLATLREQTKEGLGYKGPVIGLSRDRDDLYERINRRVDIMVEQGLFEEVQGLVDQGVPVDCQAFKGIGYKEVIGYIQGEYDKERAIDLIKRNTRRFAKRQVTWYKRMPYIQWIHIDAQTTPDDIFEQAKAMCEPLFRF